MTGNQFQQNNLLIINRTFSSIFLTGIATEFSVNGVTVFNSVLLKGL